MFELGKYTAKEHQKIVDLLTAEKVKNVILVGKAFSATNTPNHFVQVETTANGLKTY